MPLPARLTWRSYGLQIGIQSDDVRVLTEVTRLFPAGAQGRHLPADDRTYSVHREPSRSAQTPDTVILHVNGHVVLASADVKRICEALIEDLEIYVAEMARGWVFIHAGVVGWRGRAVVLPGQSFSGKTRLVAALLRAGAEYYSDEFAVLDPTGRVHPYPRPLSIRRDGAPLERFTAQALGGRVGECPMAVGLVIVTRYESGAQWRPRPLSAGSALLALLAHSVSIRRHPALVLDTLARVVAAAPAVASARGDAPDMLDALLSLTSSHGE